MRKRYYLVYITTNRLTGAYYIGAHATYDVNDGYIGSGKRLKFSINKYGRENFTRRVLRRCRDSKEMYAYEKKIIGKHLGRKKCMNLAEGGQGGWQHVNDPSCHLKKMEIEAKRVIGRKKAARTLRRRLLADPELERKRASSHSLSMKRAIQDQRFKPPTFKGQKHSPEARAKIGQANSLASRGERNAHFGKVWISNDELRLTSRVKREDVEAHLNRGWRAGRCMRYEHVQLASAE